MSTRLLDEFRGLFQDKPYLHRDSSRGDWVAMHLFEDLLALGKSSLLAARVANADRVLNASNTRVGIKSRRGDGSLGELVPGEVTLSDRGFTIQRGPIANIEIGSEVKILAKAMIKQIDRVLNDLRNQVAEFKKGGGNAICVGIVGVNHAPAYRSFEGERHYDTDGKKHKHPCQEAPDALERLRGVAHEFDEFIVLPFRATNVEPFPFEWVDEGKTSSKYAAALLRISREYDKRFPK